MWGKSNLLPAGFDLPLRTFSIWLNFLKLRMEQELIELLLFAKKALSRGQAICAQANQLSNESDHHSEIIERTWPKILFVRNHILIQLSTLERIREFLSVKIEEVGSCIKVNRRTRIKKKQATIDVVV